MPDVSEIRQAFRTLVKQPGPTMVVVLTLAIAIAASTVIYSAIEVVWHFIPAINRDLVYAAATDTRAGQPGSNGRSVVMRTQVSIPDLADWSARNATFEQLAGFSIGSVNLTGTEIPLRVTAIRATPNLPELWGFTPTLGRSFRSEDGRPGARAVVLLSPRFWRRQFSSDARVLGQSVMLDGAPHTIVGVLPTEAGTGFLRDADVFLPLVVDPLNGARDDRTLLITGRLKPGVTMAQASADLGGIARQLQREHPATNQRIGAVVLPLVEASGFNVRTLLSILGLIAVLVLVMAFANLANIVLAQATGRRHEFAVRAALGAGRFAHIRRLMTESALASVAAGVIGLALAAWGVAALRWLGGDALGLGEIRINARVIAVGLLAAFLAPLGFALWPAMRMPVPETQGLSEGGRAVGVTPRGRRTRSLIIGVQAGAAMILMLQIVLLVRTTWTLSRIPAGFDPAQVLTFRVGLSGARYGQPDAISRFSEQLIARLRALPGVASVGTIDLLPVADREASARLTVEGDAPAHLESRPAVARAAIGGDYLATLRIPLRRGRGFSAAERVKAFPVALVNEEAARRFWAGRDPLGSRIALNAMPGQETWLEVIGVVGNIQNSDIDQGPQPEVYVSASWQPSAETAVVVKSVSRDPLQLVPAIRTQVAQIDRDQPIHDVATMSKVLFDDLASTYVLASMLTVIGLVALSLSAVGIYGVVSYAVVQRRREIGVRMALGARPGAMIRMVLGQGTRPVVAGSLAGLAAAIAIASVLATAVPELDVRDPANYIAVILTIAIFASVASYVPARRAAAIDPAHTLRVE